MKRLKCLLFGHQWHHPWSEYKHWCFRCGKTQSCNDPVFEEEERVENHLYRETANDGTTIDPVEMERKVREGNKKT